MRTNHNDTLTGLKIGVFGKGGSGKSTVSILLARALRRRGHEVALFDADSTNVGSHRLLGLPNPPLPLLEWFGGAVFQGGLVSCPVDDPTPVEPRELDLSRLDPRYVSVTPDGIYLLIGGRIGGQGPGAGCDGPIAKIARDVRLVRDGNPIVTVLDFKAGLEDTARGVITDLDVAVAVVDPSITAIQIARDLSATVRAIQSGTAPATAHLDDESLAEIMRATFARCHLGGVFAILNKVPNLEAEQFLREELASDHLHLLGSINSDPEIVKAWMLGEAISDTASQDQLVNALEEALKSLQTPQPSPS